MNAWDSTRRAYQRHEAKAARLGRLFPRNETAAEFMHRCAVTIAARVTDWQCSQYLSGALELRDIVPEPMPSMVAGAVAYILFERARIAKEVLK